MHFDAVVAESGNVTAEDAGMAKRRITSMLEEDDISALKAIARSRRVSIAWVIRDAIRAYLDEGRVRPWSTADSVTARPGR